MTATASGLSSDVTIEFSVGLFIYNPTISASGGGSMSEVGSGSGSATFTVSRDLPQGWTGTPAGDELIPDTTVSVSRGGTATFNTDYQAASESDDLPDGSVTIDQSRASKSFSVVPIDDTVAEPDHPAADGSVQPETITWTVTLPDVTPPMAPTVTLTANISDDSKWYYKPWEKVGNSPLHYDSVRLGTESVETAAGGSTAIYTLKYEWRSLSSTARGVSEDFGEAASFSGALSFSQAHAWTYSGGVNFNLSDFIPIPVSVSGSFSETTTYTQGMAQNCSGSHAGEADTQFQVAGYGLYAYIEKNYTSFTYAYDYAGPADPIQRIVPDGPPQVTTAVNLGYTGLTSTYCTKRKRVWLDENDPVAAGLTSSLLPPPDPPATLN